MEKARVLIVEDNVVVAKSIEAMIADHGMDVAAICKSGEEAVALAEQQQVDIVIMDIKLDGKMSGIQTAAEIRKVHRIPVIYLSDYTDHVTVRKAKATEPANFLSKPFTQKDLLRSIDIAIYNANAARAAEATTDDGFIFIKTGPQNYSRIIYHEIQFVEAKRSYCNIQCLDKLRQVAMSMAAVAEQLDATMFMKIHRSFIVNVRKVREISGNKVVVGTHQLPVSDQHRAALMKRLNVLH